MSDQLYDTKDAAYALCDELLSFGMDRIILERALKRAYAAGQESEREACANMAVEWGNARLDDYGGNACRNLAYAIRARGQS